MDPDELRNLADPSAPLQFRPDLVATMHAKLLMKMGATHTTPEIPFPVPAGSSDPGGSSMPVGSAAPFGS